MAETASPPVPIVEHLPNGNNPHPSLEGAPEGTIGHPDAALEHAPIEHKGNVVAAPPGHGAKIEVTGEKEANQMVLKENPEEAGRWGAGILKRLRLKKAVAG